MDKKRIYVIVGVTVSILVVIGVVFLSKNKVTKGENTSTMQNTNIVGNKNNKVENPPTKPSKLEEEKLNKEKEKYLSTLKEPEKTTIWIPNIDYVVKEDNANTDKVVKKEVVLLEGGKKSNKYLRLLNTLKVYGDSPIQVLDFKDAELEGSILEINVLGVESLVNMSSVTELLIMEQIKKTVFEHFKEVEGIQIKVNGKKVKKFIKSIDISNVIKR